MKRGAAEVGFAASGIQRDLTNGLMSAQDLPPNLQAAVKSLAGAMNDVMDASNKIEQELSNLQQEIEEYQKQPNQPLPKGFTHDRWSTSQKG